MSGSTRGRLNSSDQQSRPSFYADQSWPGSGEENEEKVGIWVQLRLGSITVVLSPSISWAGFEGGNQSSQKETDRIMQASFPDLGKKPPSRLCF